jgi:hypothetical protein
MLSQVIYRSIHFNIITVLQVSGNKNKQLRALLQGVRYFKLRIVSYSIFLDVT